MNPYASPLTRTDPPPPPARGAWEVLGPAVIALALAAAALVGSLAPFFPVINQATMPRFGWSGLLLCANPLIFLLPWFWTRARSGLLGAAAMLLALAGINWMELFRTGTVAVVKNPFHDRLPSSWLWCVAPMFAAGAYLGWRGLRAKKSPVT